VQQSLKIWVTEVLATDGIVTSWKTRPLKNTHSIELAAKKTCAIEVELGQVAS
jgi:hypothetical protein